MEQQAAARPMWRPADLRKAVTKWAAARDAARDQKKEAA